MLCVVVPDPITDGLIRTGATKGTAQEVRRNARFLFGDKKPVDRHALAIADVLNIPDQVPGVRPLS